MSACCDDVEAHLDALRRRSREWADDLRDVSRTLQAHPEDATPLLDHEGPRWMATAGSPERYGAQPLRVDRHRFFATSSVERAVVMEELARTDPALVLAAPGPSMSGVLVAALADEDQRTRYYARLLEQPTWTFFALTEPGHGSDAGGLETTATPTGEGEVALSGEKCYIGNGSRAAVGVVFARSAPGPLGIAAYLVEAPAVGLTATPRSTIGLRPVQLSELVLRDVRVPEGDLLGRHLPRSRRGLHASMAVFNQLRPGVAALALGIAAGVLDILEREQPTPVKQVRAAWRAQVDAVRRLTLQAALVADRTGDGTLASVAKARACRLAEELTLDVADALGPGARFTVPGLDRSLRDARGVEFMEGTRTIQLLNVFHGLHTGRLTATGSPDGTTGSQRGQREVSPRSSRGVRLS
jgi:alkylation response protein AidB-like acyl-CoA dehydrogenase